MLASLLRIAARNVRRNWRHSLASMLSIVMGVLCIGLFEGYMKGQEGRYDDGFSRRGMLGHVIIEHAAAQGSLDEPLSHVLEKDAQTFVEDFLAARSDVEARVRLLDVTGLASDGSASAVVLGFGYDVEQGALMRGPQWAWNTLAGRPLQEAGPDSILLGKSLGRVFGCTAADSDALACTEPTLQIQSTTREGHLNVVDAEVVGLAKVALKDLDARYAIMPLPLAQRLLDTDVVSRYSVRLHDPDDAAAFIEQLDAAAAAKGVEIVAQRWQDHRLGEVYRRITSILTTFRNLVTLVVFIVVGMSVLNTHYKAVSERTREIGTLRSLGFLRRHIVTLFAFEGGLLALLAGLVGALVTVPLTLGINGLGITYKAGLLLEPIPLYVEPIPTVYLATIAALGGLSVLAAIVPARRASRMTIPSALQRA